jgi:hypothetical protein
VYYSFGLGDIARGAGLSTFVVEDGSSGRLNATRYDYYPPPAYPVSGTNVANQGPTTVYDAANNRWWAFWRDSNRATDNSYVLYATSDGSLNNWIQRGWVQDGSQRPITTRVPVGAAYDWFSNHIVVVFNTFDTTCRAPTLSGPRCVGGSDCLGTPFGYSGQLNVVTIGATNPSPVFWQGPYPLTGQAATGAPTVACEQSFAANECDIMYSGTDEGRNIWENRFQLSGQGVVEAQTGGFFTNGQSDMPMSMTFNGPTQTGNFKTAVVGTDHRIYVNTKHFVSDAWGGWQWLNTSSRYDAVLGVRVGYLESARNYQYVFAPKNQNQ